MIRLLACDVLGHIVGQESGDGDGAPLVILRRALDHVSVHLGARLVDF
jgi:hypothetical protein